MEQTEYTPPGNSKEHLLPWAGWSVWQVPTPSRRDWAKPVLGWLRHTFSVLLNSLSFLMLRFISLQFSLDNSKQFLISFVLWCMIFQIFIDVFPAFFFFFSWTWGIYLQSFNHVSFAILSSLPNVWQLEVSRVWLPQWWKKVKALGKWPWGS